jgi:hypothetical protein
MPAEVRLRIGRLVIDPGAAEPGVPPGHGFASELGNAIAAELRAGEPRRSGGAADAVATAVLRHQAVSEHLGKARKG